MGAAGYRLFWYRGSIYARLVRMVGMDIDVDVYNVDIPIWVGMLAVVVRIRLGSFPNREHASGRRNAPRLPQRSSVCD